MKKIHFIIFLLSITVVAIVIVIWQSRNSPSSSPIIIGDDYLSPIENTSTTFNKVQFKGKTSFTVNRLPLAQISINDNRSELSSSLANYCQINQGELNKYFRGVVCDYTSYEDGARPQVIFNNLSNNLPVGININDAQMSINHFIQTVYQNNSPSLMLNGISYFTLAEDSTVELEYAINSFKATHAWLFYSFAHHDIPLVPHNDNDSYFSFIIDTANQLNKVELRSNLYQIQDSAEQYPLISINEAIANIEQGKGYLASYYAAGDINSDFLSQFNQVVFNEVKLEYRMNITETMAIPSYHFIGTGFNKLDKPMGIEVVTPAINFTTANN